MFSLMAKSNLHLFRVVFLVVISLFGMNVRLSAADEVRQAAVRVAAELTDDGWRAFEDAAPVADQLEACYALTFDVEHAGECKYVLVSGTSDKCETLEEAEEHALAIAKVQIAQQCEAIELRGLKAEINAENEYENMHTTFNENIYVYKLFATYTTEMTVANQISARTDVYSMDEVKVYYQDHLLLTNRRVGREADTYINWDAVVEYCDASPFAASSWTLLKLYRKSYSGYVVTVTICTSVAG